MRNPQFVEVGEKFKNTVGFKENMLAGQLQPTGCQFATSLIRDVQSSTCWVWVQRKYIFILCAHWGILWVPREALEVGPEIHMARHPHLCLVILPYLLSQGLLDIQESLFFMTSGLLQLFLVTVLAFFLLWEISWVYWAVYLASASLCSPLHSEEQGCLPSLPPAHRIETVRRSLQLEWQCSYRQSLGNWPPSGIFCNTEGGRCQWLGSQKVAEYLYQPGVGTQPEKQSHWKMIDR